MDSLEDFGAGVGTYSSIFNAYHDIIHPRKPAKELRVNVQVPVNKNFGLTHALKFATLKANPAAALLGPAAPKQEPADGVRTYHIGAYFVRSSAEGYKTVAHASMGLSTAESLATVQSQLTSALTVRGALWARPEGKSTIWHSLAAWYKGVDYTAAVHTANLELLHMSYLQRLDTAGLLRGVQVGGELLYDHGCMSLLRQRPEAPVRPLSWSLGVASEVGEGYKALAAVWQPNRAKLNGFLGLQRDVTEHSTLVAKYEVKPFDGTSVASLGYKVRFPRSRSVVQAVLDSDQTVKASFERRLLSNVKFNVAAIIHKAPKVTPGQPPAPGPSSNVGMTLTIGNMPREPLWLSPALLRSHTVLHR